MKTYISKQKLSELEKELEERKLSVRAEIGERLKRAKEMGDLSENADYAAAKDELAENERRIIELEEIIHSAQVTENYPPMAKKNKIGVGCIVKAQTSDGLEKEFKIVGAHDSNPSQNLISNESPLGKAFLNRQIGEEVEYNLPSGEKKKYKIIDIV